MALMRLQDKDSCCNISPILFGTRFASSEVLACQASSITLATLRKPGTRPKNPIRSTTVVAR